MRQLANRNQDGHHFFHDLRSSSSLSSKWKFSVPSRVPCIHGLEPKTCKCYAEWNSRSQGLVLPQPNYDNKLYICTQTLESTVSYNEQNFVIWMLNTINPRTPNPKPQQRCRMLLKGKAEGRKPLTWSLDKSSSPWVAGTSEIYGAIDVFQQYNWPVCRLNEQLPQIDVAAHLITQRERWIISFSFAMVSGPKRDVISSAPTSTGILNTRLVRDDQHIKIKPILTVLIICGAHMNWSSSSSSK